MDAHGVGPVCSANLGGSDSVRLSAEMMIMMIIYHDFLLLYLYYVKLVMNWWNATILLILGNVSIVWLIWKIKSDSAAQLEIKHVIFVASIV